MRELSEVRAIVDNMFFLDKKDINALLAEVGLAHLKIRKLYGWWEIYDTRFGGFPVKHSSFKMCIKMVLAGHRPMPFPGDWDKYKHLLSEEDVKKFNSYNGTKVHIAGHYEGTVFVPFVYVK